MSDIEPVNYEMMWKVSQRVTNTPFVPSALRGKPESVLACILYGAELGLGPMQSLNSIHVIEGRTAMSPELMRAMVARHGHRIDVLENTNTVCEMKGTRSDTGGSATVRWTMEDAKMAGLAGKNNWKTYPRAMLMARCTSELCRILFPDVIAGLSYTPEEIVSIEGIELPQEHIPEEAIPEIEEVVEAEIVEEKPEPKKKAKIGEAATISEIAEEMVADGSIAGDSDVPSFEERLRIAETWGNWPLVKGLASMLSKVAKCDKPESFVELAHNEKLWLMVLEAMRQRGK